MDKSNRIMVRALRKEYPHPVGIVLDVGGYDVSGNVAAILEDEVYSVDLVMQDGLSIVADAHCLPVKCNSCAAVWSTSTLQYVDNPFLMVSEIRRVLMPGGIAYLEAPTSETPGLVGRHWRNQVQDSFRFYPKGMRSMLMYARFDKILHVGGPSDRVWGVAEK